MSLYVILNAITDDDELTVNDSLNRSVGREDILNASSLILARMRLLALRISSLPTLLLRLSLTVNSSSSVMALSITYKDK